MATTTTTTAARTDMEIPFRSMLVSGMVSLLCMSGSPELAMGWEDSVAPLPHSLVLPSSSSSSSSSLVNKPISPADVARLLLDTPSSQRTSMSAQVLQQLTKQIVFQDQRLAECEALETEDWEPCFFYGTHGRAATAPYLALPPTMLTNDMIQPSVPSASGATATATATAAAGGLFPTRSRVPTW